MKILSALILLLSCSVCSAATITAKVNPITTRVNGDLITGDVDYLFYVEGVEQVATADTSATFEADSGQEICVRVRVIENDITDLSAENCKTLPFSPSTPDIQIQIIFNIGS